MFKRVAASLVALAGAAMAQTNATYLRVDMATPVNGNNYLSFNEVFIFDKNGVNIAPTATYTSSGAGNGGTVAGGADFLLGAPWTGTVFQSAAAPTAGTTGQNPYAAIGTWSWHDAQGGWWQASFPSTQIAQVLFVNRADGTVVIGRITQNGYRATLGNDAAVISQGLIGWIQADGTGGTAKTLSYASSGFPFLPPRFPVPTDPVQLQRRDSWVRYVRVQNAANGYLHFKELMVFDATNTNVARGKSCATNQGLYAGRTDVSCDKAVDHVVHMEFPSDVGDSMFHAGATTTGTWVDFDLGGMYDVRRIIFWNRFLGPPVSGGSATGGAVGPRIVGATISVRNWYNDTLLSWTLTGAPITNIVVVLPSPTPLMTPVPTGTATASSTASASGTATATLSWLASASVSASPSGTASATPSPALALPVSVRIRALGGTNLLIFGEVMVFSPSGTLLSHPANGAVVTSSEGQGTEGRINDMCVDTWTAAQAGGVAGTCANYASRGLGPVNVTISWPVPSAVGWVYFTNNVQRLTQNAGLGGQRVFIDVINQDGTLAGPSGVVTAQQMNTFTFAPLPTGPTNADASSPAQQSEANRQALVRFIRIDSVSVNEYFHFKELMAFDQSMTNVALLKPVTGSPQISTDASAIYRASFGNDGIIDLCIEPCFSNMVQSQAVTPNFWQVDLGGVFNLSTLLLFNRGGPTVGPRMTNSQVRFYNFYGVQVGQLALGGSYVQRYDAQRFMYAPTSSPTGTPSPSGTPSSSETPSSSATATGTGTTTTTGTPTPTPTLSTGQTASETNTASSTPSNTASATTSSSITATGSLTASATPSLTQSPFNPFPAQTRVDNAPSTACMNMFEVFTIDNAGRIVSAAQAGGVASQRSTFINGAITYAASNSIDLIADPWGANALGTNGLSHSVCPSNFGVREFWTNNYAPVAPVSQAIFVNRMDSGLGVRIAQGEGVLSVVAHNGTTVGRLSLGATAWQTLSLAPFLPPATPDASSPEQQSEANRVNGVRFVTVTIPANLRLNFRELWVIDGTTTIVSRGKAVSMVTASGAATAGHGVDMIVDLENAATTSNAVRLDSTGLPGASWTVDLGAAYTGLSKIILIGDYTTGRPAGTRIALTNWYGSPLGLVNVSITGTVQTFNVPDWSFPVTPTTTATPSSSATATASLSPGTVPSITSSSSATASLTPSPLSPNPVSAQIYWGWPTKSNADCFHLLEVLIFDREARLISLSSRGAVASASSVIAPTGSDASNAINGLYDMQLNGGIPAGSSLFHAACGGAQWLNIQFPPQLPLYPAGLPRAIGAAYVINRMDGGLGPRLTNGLANFTLTNSAGQRVGSYPLFASGVSHIPIAPMAPPPAAVQLATATDDEKALLVRWVRIACVSNQYLMAREVMVFDQDDVNVALGKPVTGSPQFVETVNTGAMPFSLAAVTNGIIDQDNLMDLSHSATTPGFMQIDLQGLYAVKSMAYFNRGPYNDAGNLGRIGGGTATFLNAFGAVIGSVTMNGNYHQNYPVTLFPPTPSGTRTPSGSGTPSVSPTRTGTPSASGTGTSSSSTTATPTASLSSGGTPSITSSASPTSSLTASVSTTGSNTASVTASPSVTASLTQSPFSALASRVRLSVTGQYLNLQEVMAITKSGRVVSAQQSGGSAAFNGAPYSADNAASRGIDLFMDPWGTAGGGSVMAHSQSTSGLVTWTSTFYPADLAAVVVVNRGEACCSARFIAGNGALDVFAQNGTSLLSEPLTSAQIAEYSLGAYNAVAPLAPLPTDPVVAATTVRYVRISAPVGCQLRMHELLVLDADQVNIGRGRAVSASHATTGGMSASKLVDTVIDWDNSGTGVEANCVNIPASATTAGAETGPSVTVDLGGLATVSTIILFTDRYIRPCAGTRMTLINHDGLIVSDYAVSASVSVQTFVNITQRLYAPSATPTVTPSPSQTGSGSQSQTGTGSPSGTATVTRSRSPSGSTTVSRSESASPTNTGSSGSTPSGTPSNTPSWSPTRSLTQTGTSSPSPSRTPPSTSSETQTGTPSRTGTKTGTPSSSGSRTGTPSSSSTCTASVSATATETSSVSTTATGTPSTSGTGTASSSPSETGTASSSGTGTATASSSGSGTATPSSSGTGTATPSASGTGTPESTATSSLSATGTPAATGTRTAAPTGTATKTRVALPSSSPTRTRTGTATRTRTRTKTKTKTRTPSKKKKLLRALEEVKATA